LGEELARLCTTNLLLFFSVGDGFSFPFLAGGAMACFFFPFLSLAEPWAPSFVSSLPHLKGYNLSVTVPFVLFHLELSFCHCIPKEMV
jgi:hypothetical protein